MTDLAMHTQSIFIFSSHIFLILQVIFHLLSHLTMYRSIFVSRGVPVVAVRMLTDRESGRSHRFCFVEFANDKCQQVSIS